MFGAVNLQTTATSTAAFFSRLTDEDGPVCRLLGPELHSELLTSQVTGSAGRDSATQPRDAIPPRAEALRFLAKIR